MMNIFQRIILVIGAIAFVIVLWTAPKVQYPPNGGMMIENYQEDILANVVDIRTASIRGIAVLGATALIWFAYSELQSKKILSKYDNMLSEIKSTLKKVDFSKLRLSYASSPMYEPQYIPDKILDTRENLIKEDNIKEALSRINSILERNYLNIRAHQVAALLYDKFGKRSKVLYHNYFAKGLLNSVYQSGDGQSFDTAFVVIDIAEEYAIIEDLGLSMISQKLVKHEGHQFDILKISDKKSANIFDLYFNIDYPKGWLDNRISLPSS